jgi:hypothetical protein
MPDWRARRLGVPGELKSASGSLCRRNGARFGWGERWMKHQRLTTVWKKKKSRSLRIVSPCFTPFALFRSSPPHWEREAAGEGAGCCRRAAGPITLLLRRPIALGGFLGSICCWAGWFSICTRGGMLLLHGDQHKRRHSSVRPRKERGL